MTLQALTQDLIVALCDNVQSRYDYGNLISQDIVHQTASELLEENKALMALIGDDEVSAVDGGDPLRRALHPLMPHILVEQAEDSWVTILVGPENILPTCGTDVPPTPQGVPRVVMDLKLMEIDPPLRSELEMREECVRFCSDPRAFGSGFSGVGAYGGWYGGAGDGGSYGGEI